MDEERVLSALKLLAEDADGLAVIAAAAQDGLVKAQDIRFDARSRTFGMEINRFQWERAGKRAWLQSGAVYWQHGFHGIQGVGVMAAQPLRGLSCLAQQRSLRGMRAPVWPTASTLPHVRGEPAIDRRAMRRVPAPATALGRGAGSGGL
jgi:hypothetical protein